jgi:hypothetical protein
VLPLRLSRACLGKTTLLSIKWRKQKKTSPYLSVADETMKPVVYCSTCWEEPACADKNRERDAVCCQPSSRVCPEPVLANESVSHHQQVARKRFSHLTPPAESLPVMSATPDRTTSSGPRQSEKPFTTPKRSYTWQQHAGARSSVATAVLRPQCDGLPRGWFVRVVE